jgi:isopenicillin N synthase-like dioxygenase
MNDSPSLPIVDVGPLLARTDASGRRRAAEAIGAACRESGFFYAVGHGIAEELWADLQTAATRFFALPEARKLEIAMARGGRAWRGYFPVGGELTSGKPDLKEGLYLGEELGADDPRVRAGLPLHGANLFPADVPELRSLVLAYMAAATRAAHALMEGMALSLGLEAEYFYVRYTVRPTILFRIFHYPAAAPADEGWGVGEHTDYGLLTLLAQDDLGGLQVKTRAGWTAAPPVRGALVCNIGDMLDRLTGGVYRSTPHRVRNNSGQGRLSFPFFFDPAFDAAITPLPAYAAHRRDDRAERWDGASVHELSGTYGDYLIGKVSKVFPALRREVG